MESLSGVKHKQTKDWDGARLNLLVLLMAIPLWAIVSGPFVLKAGFFNYKLGVARMLDVWGVLFLFSGIFIHEFLHAISWILLEKSSFKQIVFGINWSVLTPYTHFKKPIKVWKYAVGGAMPAMVMGIIPAIFSFVFNRASINFVAFMFVWASGADIIGLWKLRNLSRHSFVLDCPDKLGFVIVKTGTDAGIDTQTTENL